MKKQLGITLIESIATLGIMSAVAVGTVYMSGQYTADTRTTGAAEHMRVFAEAARAYAKDHRAALMSQATNVTPVMISSGILSSAGYLQPGFSSTNAFRQNVCALVLEPSAGVLNTLVVAEGGDPLDDITLAHFASQMGAGGGGRFTTNGTQLQGAGGGWTLPVTTFDNRANTVGRRCDGTTPGAVQIPIGTPVYAQWMDASDVADPGFLSRDIVPGNPTANTMQTNINMGGNRVANLASVTIGAACGAGVTNGELSNGPNGEVVSCVSGVWTVPGLAYWGPITTAFGSLPGCTAANMGETRRVTNIDSVFVCTGIRWDVAINPSGDFSLPQHLRVAGNAAIGGNIQVAGNAQINGTTNLYGTTTAHSTLNANAGMNVGAGQTISGNGQMQIESAGNLHLKPWNGAGQVVVGGSGGNGNLYAYGRLSANGSHAITAHSNDWSVVTRDAGGGANSAQKSSAGSIYTNDVYLRSKGKWVSEMGGATGAPSSGWSKLDNGMIIQWGTGYLPTPTNYDCQTFNFPIPFPNAAVSLVSTPTGAGNGGGDEDFWGNTILNNAQGRVCTTYDGTYYYNYIAIGY